MKILTKKPISQVNKKLHDYLKNKGFKSPYIDFELLEPYNNKEDNEKYTPVAIVARKGSKYTACKTHIPCDVTIKKWASSLNFEEINNALEHYLNITKE